MKYLLGALCACAMATVYPALASASAHEGMGNVDNGRKIFQEGKGDAVPACQSCHGMDGLGNDDMGTPRLAYQVDTYVLKQLKDFAADKRTDNTMSVMNDIAKSLLEQDKKDLAAFVYTLKTPFMGSDLDTLRENDVEVGKPYKGAEIVHYGLPDHGVPACQSCHGYNGRSVGRMYPAIGGQRYQYIVNQLTAFRAGERTNDYKSQMQKVAQHLTDDDIQNAAAFLTGAKPVSSGNPRAPEHM
ncbi:MAG: c-type cytochrome [Mariprofundaceae bacterium]|nr:c-type cytochrome [Mariprofundaceae bacterium]